jgi:hypothetical protein
VMHRLIRPVPPKDFTQRAHDPLDSGDSNICIAAAKRIRGPLKSLTPQEQRSIGMASYPIENLPSWIRHESGEAYCAFSRYVGVFQANFEPKMDDPAHVSDIIASMPDKWLNRLAPVFVGLESVADSEEYFRHRYMKLSGQYDQAMKTAVFLPGRDGKKMYRESARVLQAFVRLFAEFFGELREWIGQEACSGSRWSEGDSWRKKWDMTVFTRFQTH